MAHRAASSGTDEQKVGEDFQRLPGDGSLGVDKHISQKVLVGELCGYWKHHWWCHCWRLVGLESKTFCRICTTLV